MTEIILKATGELVDSECREYLEKQIIRIDTINDRTKLHTLDIQRLRREIKELKTWLQYKEKEVKIK